jgi:Tfp pilus assembly protein PilN
MKRSKQLRIDFAPASWQRSLARIHPLSWCLLILLIVFSIFILIKAEKLILQQKIQHEELRSKQAKLLQRLPAPPAAPRRVAPEPQTRAVNQAVSQLNLPWHNLLNALEDGTPNTIALLSIEPDVKKQMLKGVAEAQDSDAMLDFITQLKKQTFFDQVNLSKHEINEQDPNKPLRFQFEARWIGSAP